MLSADQLLSEYARELNQFTRQNIDYHTIAERMKTLSGCSYVMLDKFDREKMSYTTVALVGIGDSVRKAAQIMGFELVGQNWEYIPDRKDHAGNKITFFNSLAELEDSSLSPLVMKMVDRMLNLGSIAVVKSTKDDQIIGDFTLMFRKKESLQHQNQVELYADMVGMTHARIDAETELHKSRDQLSSLVTNIPGMVYQFRYWPDGKTSFQYASEQILDVFGLSPEMARKNGQFALDNVHPDDQDRMKASILKSFQELSIWEMDFRVLHPARGERWIWGLSRPEKQHDGSVIWHGYAADYTDRKRMEEDLRKARIEAEEASKAKTQFLASMSHEIRTPLNGVIGFTELLAGTPLTDVQQKYVDNANAAGKSLLEIINSILDLSKIEAGKMELDHVAFDLTELLEEVVEMLKMQARKKGLHLRLVTDQHRPNPIVSDPARLRQILLNLLSNAIKFTEKGGVTLRLAYDFIGTNRIALKLDVVDTGIGIAEEQMQRLFQAFTQGDASINRKYGGTGLGLVISRLIVDLMGGTISAESQPGNGSAFTVSFEADLAAAGVSLDRLSDSGTRFSDSGSPILKFQDQGEFHAGVFPEQPSGTVREVDHEDAVRGVQGTDENGPCVLVAEDIEMNMLLTRTLLKRSVPGVRVLEARNGAEALQQFIEARPDFVLMDIQMPGMDGLSATRAIRKHEKANSWAPTPIVALTAGVLNEEREECLRAGMDHFLSKPIDLKALRPVISSLLAGE
jgi:PAS domain S-box-containing protein